MAETNDLKEYCLQSKQKVNILLIQELDNQLDSIELIKQMKRKGILSICGIVRVFDYKHQLKDSSILLFIAADDEANTLINKSVIRILGNRIKIVLHDLIMKSVVSTDNDLNLPSFLILHKTIEVYRPLLSELLLLELERLKATLPLYSDLNGIIIPFYVRKQKSRYFMFIIMANNESAKNSMKYTKENWTDGRLVERADNSLIVISKIRESDLKYYEFGKYNKIVLNDKLDELNLISTNLHNE